MINTGTKSYSNSYLYTRVPNYERNLLEYVMKAERIDKQSEQFAGIIEDTKRRQTSAVLSRVLAREDVLVCTYTKPLPAAFKVFACKDVRDNGAMKVFIDVTGLINLKNGFFECNRIDVFTTYLLSAMTMLVYYTQPIKFTGNSTIVETGTECFVALSSHIFDYLRLNGYSENKLKISYILGMYFQVNLLGLDREDDSTKNVAAKVAGVPMKDIKAMEIYYDDEYLVNIDTLLKGISATFKMPGMTTDVFVEKWTWFYGTGTHFGCELFTAFSNIITTAYCGSYINNQKTIEKCCGRSMVNYTNAVLRIGSDVIDNGFRYESTYMRNDFEKAKDTSLLQEVLVLDKRVRELRPTNKDMYGDPDKLCKKIDTLLKDEYFAKNEKKRSKEAYTTFMDVVPTADRFLLSDDEKYNNVTGKVAKCVKKYMTKKDQNKVIDYLVKIVHNLAQAESDENHQLHGKKNVTPMKNDIKSALKAYDPKNAALSESYHFDYSNTALKNQLLKEAHEKGKSIITVTINEKRVILNVDVEDAKNIIEARTNEICRRYNSDKHKMRELRRDIDKVIKVYDNDGEFDGYDVCTNNVPKIKLTIKDETQYAYTMSFYEGNSVPIKIAMSNTVKNIIKDLMKDKEIASLSVLQDVVQGDSSQSTEVRVKFKK